VGLQQTARGSRGWLAASFLCFALAWTLVAAAPEAFADTFRPNKRSDDPAGGLTLREAVQKANNRAGRDTVILRGGKTYDLQRVNTLGNDEDANDLGDLDILDSLRVRSSNRQLATIDANRLDRVFEMDQSDAVKFGLTRLRLTGGESSSLNGGAIHGGAGTLSINRSRLTGNISEGNGGGIYIFNEETTLTVNRSRIGNNLADGGNGGGIYNFLGEITTKVDRSTVSGNEATFNGGGLYFDAGNPTLRRSTVSGNDAAGNGGGVYVSSSLRPLLALNSTVAQNRADTDGGGIYFSGSGQGNLRSITVARNRGNTDSAGTDDGGGMNAVVGAAVTVRNSLVANNTVNPPGTAPDCAGTYTSEGRNLFTSLAGCTGFAVPPNILSSMPRIGQLSDNGGPTRTIALRQGSPAIDRATPASPSRDQRGVRRNDPGGPDIGAFERN
jgi:parallel beta-helix repeat protein